MLNLRLLPVVMTAAISAVVLFGGWFAYQSFAMEEPFIQQVSEIEGVESVTLDRNRRETAAVLKIKPGTDLQNAYQAASGVGEDVFGKDKLTITVLDDTSDALEEWWSQALFDVAQSMETKQYSLIPERLNALAASNGFGVHTEMDDTNVYITLTEGPHCKYIILPRTPAMMGVWPNE